MYKNIKRIISLTIILVSVTTIGPLKYFNLGSKAYAAASTYSYAKDGELTSLEINSSDGKTIDLLDDYDGEKTELTNTTFYYVRTNAKDDKIAVSASVKGEGYVVKLFESDRKNATGHDMGEKIDLDKGKSTLYLRTFTSQVSYDRSQDKEDVTSSEKMYRIYVQNTDSNGQDEAYLDNLTINGGDIKFGFDYTKSNYSVSIQENIDAVEIKAVPEHTDYTVKINDNTARDDNKYTRKVNLNKGKNEIIIRVQDDDIKERIYKLNIYRGIAIPKNQESSNDSKNSELANKETNSDPIKVKDNQWVQKNDSWQYNDATGNPMKNTWFYDKSNGNNYYLQGNGALAIGWLNYNDHWYYSNALGVRQTGWENINGKWYYLNSEGIMQTGWVQDKDGKYYYLNSNGDMAYNTMINGYRLDSNGSWIQ